MLGIEGFAVGGVEGVAVVRGQRAGAASADDIGERISKTIAPRARDRGDAIFQNLSLDDRRRTLVAADNVVGAGE